MVFTVCPRGDKSLILSTRSIFTLIVGWAVEVTMVLPARLKDVVLSSVSAKRVSALRFRVDGFTASSK